MPTTPKKEDTPGVVESSPNSDKSSSADSSPSTASKSTTATSVHSRNPSFSKSVLFAHLPSKPFVLPAPHPTFHSTSNTPVHSISKLLSTIKSWQQQYPPSKQLIVPQLSRSIYLSFARWISEHETQTFKFYYDEELLDLTLMIRTEHESVTSFVMDTILKKLRDLGAKLGGSLEAGDALCRTFRRDNCTTFGLRRFDSEIWGGRENFAADASLRPIEEDQEEDERAEVLAREVENEGDEDIEGEASLPTLLIETALAQSEKALWSKVDKWLMERPGQSDRERPKLVIAINLDVQSSKRFKMELCLFGYQNAFPFYPSLPYPDFMINQASLPTESYLPHQVKETFKSYSVFGRTTIVKVPGHVIKYGSPLTIPAAIIWRKTPSNIPRDATLDLDLDDLKSLAHSLRTSAKDEKRKFNAYQSLWEEWNEEFGEEEQVVVEENSPEEEEEGEMRQSKRLRSRRKAHLHQSEVEAHIELGEEEEEEEEE